MKRPGGEDPFDVSPNLSPDPSRARECASRGCGRDRGTDRERESVFIDIYGFFLTREVSLKCHHDG